MRLRGVERVVCIPDWHLTNAEILYHLPDHPGVLQSFIWQKVDRARASRSCTASWNSGAGTSRTRSTLSALPPSPYGARRSSPMLRATSACTEESFTQD
jgi:hypothetical protein